MKTENSPVTPGTSPTDEQPPKEKKNVAWWVTFAGALLDAVASILNRKK